MYEVLRLEDSEHFEALSKVIKEEYEAAVSNLINHLTPKEDFPGNNIPVRPVRGGTDVQYIPGWWFIRQANALFQYRWSFDILEYHVGDNQVYCKGRITIQIPGYEETTEYPDGRKVTKKVEGTSITKTQFGGSDIKRLKETKAIIDIGDDLKSAATDALKKCLTQFGLASDIYGPREMKEVGKANSKQLDALYATADKNGISREDVIRISTEKYGDRPEDLREIEVLNLLNHIRSMVTVKSR